MRFLAVTMLLALSPISVSYGQSGLRTKACDFIGTQAELNQCYAKEARKADAALTATYQQLVSRLKDNKLALARLIASERAWVAFRDADIAAMWPIKQDEAAKVTYGSAHPMCVSMAIAGMTYQRKRDLEERLNRQEGDVCSDAVAGCISKPLPNKPESSSSGTR